VSGLWFDCLKKKNTPFVTFLECWSCELYIFLVYWHQSCTRKLCLYGLFYLRKGRNGNDMTRAFLIENFEAFHKALYFVMR